MLLTCCVETKLSFSVFAEELFGLLSSQQGRVDFTCSPCSQHQTSHSILKEELQRRLTARVEEVLTDLLSSNSTQHLITCKAVRAAHKTLRGCTRKPFYPLKCHILVFLLQRQSLIMFQMCRWSSCLLLSFSVRNQTSQHLSGNSNQSVIYKRWRGGLKGAVTPQ